MSEYLSECCGDAPYGEVHGSSAPKDSPYWYPEKTGRCSGCGENAVFTKEEEVES